MGGLRVGIDGLADAYDAVVVGAGPAGTVCSFGLARRGLRVLVLEKESFPRWKVCGACLGASGVRALERIGLGAALEGAGARAVPGVVLLWGGSRRGVGLGGMRAVSRGAMDLALAGAAAEAGAEMRFGVRCEAHADGRVVLRAGGESRTVRGGVVVQAGGLRAARGAGAEVRAGAWIGLGVSSSGGAGAGACGDELVMAVAEGGYVGRIVTEDRRANWAAAVDPELVRACGSPGAAVARLLDGNALGIGAPRRGWVGTPALTRRVPVVDGRLVRVGDAAGYVEPITGEGMSWGIIGAESLVPIAADAIRGRGCLGAWARSHTRLMRARRMRCGLVARGLRSPVAMRAAMGVLRDRDVPSGGNGFGDRFSAWLVGGMIGGGS